MNKKLKRCPFCGGEVKQDIDDLDPYRNAYAFLCKDCKMEIIYPYSDEEDAIKAWNTRKPMDRIVERLEEERKEITKWDSDKHYIYKEGADWMGEKAIEIVKEEGDIK